jgi:hypothetical protein
MEFCFSFFTKMEYIESFQILEQDYDTQEKNQSKVFFFIKENGNTTFSAS